MKSKIIVLVSLLTVALVPEVSRASNNPLYLIHGYDSNSGVAYPQLVQLIQNDPAWQPAEIYREEIYAANDRDGPGPFQPLPYTVNSDIVDVASGVGQNIVALYQRNGNTRVDVVAHSMGGVVIREVLAQGFDAFINRIVTLGATHYGVHPTVSNWNDSPQQDQQVYGGGFLWKLATDWEDNKLGTFSKSQLLAVAGTRLNDGDGLVTVESAALMGSPVRYVDRVHSVGFGLASLYDFEDTGDIVYRILQSFLCTTTAVPGENFTPDEGALFIQLADETGAGIAGYDDEFVINVRFEVESTWHGEGNWLNGAAQNPFTAVTLINEIGGGQAYTLEIPESSDTLVLAFSVEDIFVPDGFTSVVRIPSAHRFEGDTQAEFTEVTGPSGAVFSGVGSDTLNWGTPLSGSQQNELMFAGASFAGNGEEEFSLGNLFYHNGEANTGSSIWTAELTLELTFSLPGSSVETAPVVFDVDSTINSSDEEASADSLRLLPFYPGAPTTIGGDPFALRVSFGEPEGSGIGERSQVVLLENASTNIPLKGEFVRSLPVSGTGSGIFTDITGNASLVVVGEDTNSITTGTGGNPSSYVIGDSGFAGGTEIPFRAATMTFYNGVNQGDSAATAAVLDLAISGFPQSFRFPLEFIATPNSGSPEDAADIVRILNRVSSQIVVIEGIPHELYIFFANSSPDGFTGVTDFSVFEDATATADIMGVFTRFVPGQRDFQLTFQRPDPDTIVISWPSVPGNTYQVEETTGAGGFVPSGASFTATNSITVVTRTISGPARIFRVRETDPE